MYTFGNSAGGCLSLALTRHMVMHQSSSMQGTVKGAVAIVAPTLHPDNVPEAYHPFYTAYEEYKDDVPIIDQTSMRQFFEYAGIQPDDKTILTALDLEAHKKFPPTYLATCGCDPVRDDGTVMARALKNAGVSVKQDHYEGLPHIFWYFPSVPEGYAFYQNTIEGIKWVINQM